MASDISLQSTEAFLAQCNAQVGNSGTPLLVFRLRDLPQLSWKHGRTYARKIERKATAIFAEASRVLLRDADCIIHDESSEWYAIALYARGRSGRVTTPVDARSTLTRVHLALERDTQLAIDTGWTALCEDVSADVFASLLEDALFKGARERERYAFFSLIGHELRTPLTSIRGYLETVLEDEALDATTMRRFTEIAYRETLRVGRLVESLFDISLLDLRRGYTAENQCSLQAALDAALIATAAVREQRRVQITVCFNADAAPLIHEDALTQILINLIDNAAKHGRAGGNIVITVHADDERCIQVLIDDDGPGIPYEDRSILFELGERGRTEARGTGIGLGLVRLFLERAGGEIDVTTSTLGGASFRFVLPRMAHRPLAGSSRPLL